MSYAGCGGCTSCFVRAVEWQYSGCGVAQAKGLGISRDVVTVLYRCQARSARDVITVSVLWVRGA